MTAELKSKKVFKKSIKNMFKKTLVSVFLVFSLLQITWAELIPVEKGKSDSSDNHGILWYDGSLFTVEGKGWEGTETFY